MELDGIVSTDPSSMAPYLMHLVGGPQTHLPASGLVAALQSSREEARCAAADALRAVMVAFGPRVDLAQVGCLPPLPHSVAGLPCACVLARTIAACCDWSFCVSPCRSHGWCHGKPGCFQSA